uniref:Nucleolar protein 11 n=1 Tax=Gasterosteus aculeatus aculeatus TaxID=481459 RepID=A0AAQ4R2U1_GASAC
MAALYAGYTLRGLAPAQNRPNSGIQGVEAERDSDHVVVTDSTRCVTLYKVSDQKPLSCWTVKQGHTLTGAAVYNARTQEYVAVSDRKVIRIWKEDDIILDKAFKATVSSDVWRVHCVAGGDPVVLFHRGAVRLLDSLLSAPQQPIEEVLSPEEAISWSTNIVTESQQFVIFTTEQKGDHFLYLQRLNPNSLQRYHLEREEPGLSPLSFSVSYRDKHIRLLYLYPNGHVYESVVSVRAPVPEEGAQALPLPRSLLLSLPVGEGLLQAASAQELDEAHVAVVGVPHPSAGSGKDFLCIWNTNFQTLQAGKEMAGKIYGQLWSFWNKLFIPHGKTFSVIPYDCPKSSLASALGKQRQSLTNDQVLELIKVRIQFILGSLAKHFIIKMLNKSVFNLLMQTAPVEEVQREVQLLLSRTDTQDLQTSVGQLASTLASRSLNDPAFYTPSSLVQLVHTRYLCHSVCPDLVLLALERKDYFLCQLCLQFFPDIPEVVTCASLIAQEHEAGLNGFSLADEEDRSDNLAEGGATAQRDNEKASAAEQMCPVGLHKAVLLYPASARLLRSNICTMLSNVLFLQYLQFVYLKFSHDACKPTQGLRSPSLTQVMDWMGLLLDAHFTVLVMTPDVKDLLLNLHRFVKSQVRFVSELGKIEGSLQELDKMALKRDVGQYSIEIIELF